MGARVAHLYKGCQHHNQLSFLDPIRQKVFRLSNKVNEEDVLNEIEEASENEFSETLFEHTNVTLSAAIEKILSEKDTSSFLKLVEEIKPSIEKFANMKALHYTKLLKEVPDKDLLGAYYAELKAEKNLVTRGLRSAKQWIEFEETKETYPNLEYLPTLSANPRQEHKKYYGLIRPINDPIWKKIYPPNGWNCKCRIRRTRKEPNMPDLVVDDLPNGVVGNVALEKKVFSDTHPYYKKYGKLV